MSKGSHDEIQWNMCSGVWPAGGLLSVFTLSPRNIQGKQDWNEKRWRVALVCRMSSLSSRPHCCRRAPGTWAWWPGGFQRSAWPHQAVPKGCHAAVMLKALCICSQGCKSIEHDFWRGWGMQVVPDWEEEAQGCWSSLLKLFEGHHKDVSMNLRKATE